MSKGPQDSDPSSSEHPSMDVDMVCVGFGPATGGFLTTLTRAWNENPADPAFESQVAPGMPLQVICYERADDLAAGVSGLVTRGQGIRASFPDLDLAEIPMAAAVTEERVFYLLDPIGRAAAAGFCLWATQFFVSESVCSGFAITRLNCHGRRHFCISAVGWSCRSDSLTNGSLRS